MSDEGEKTCPLCAEEMDLTDKQLKPCKCGYEICVWCWHHIMDMAEKDNVEGRCPACRTPYNKEKIVDKAAQCERLVSEINVEKKVKSKSKGKTPDGKKHLSSVRVIQRNLVYVMGLPLNLADEDLLQQKEYFAQYGKVQKVSISRTAGGSIQQFPNNTCSVYITYLNEEEAIRCIQTVHGYTLEGKPLRACFGTTKYCHAWLRNVPCGNPDCLYLHEIGTQEDSFTKDEIISAYTRSRVQQITGAPIDMQRRSGNILPPPSHQFCNSDSSSSGTTNKISTNNPDKCSEDILGSSVWQTPASSVRGCHSSTIVPIPTATWGKRALDSQLSTTSITSAVGHSKQKPDSCSVSLSFSTAVAKPSQAKVSMVHSDSVKKLNGKIQPSIQRNKSELEPLASDVVYLDGDNHRSALDISGKVEPSLKPTITCPPTTLPLKVDGSMDMRDDLVKSSDFNEISSGINPDKPKHVLFENKAQGLCSNTLLLSKDTQGIQHRDSEECMDFLISPRASKVASSNKDLVPPRYQSELRLEPEIQIAQSTNSKVEDDFDVQRLGDKEAFSGTDYLPNLSNLSNSSRVLNPQEAYGLQNVNVDSFLIDKKFDNLSISESYSISPLSNGYTDNRGGNFSDLSCSSNHSSYMIPTDLKMKHVGRYGNGGDFVTNNSVSNNDIGENSIISNILSMDFESWDESLASPRDLAKLLGENDKRQESIGVSNSWKAQNNKSRFSFARQEDQVPSFEQSSTSFGQTLKNHSFRNSFKDNGNYFPDDGGISNGFSGFTPQHPGNLIGMQNRTSNISSVSRPPVSAPPGFSGPSKAPPPGFTSYDRIEQTFEKNSGNHLLNGSSLLRNTNQLTSTMHIDTTNMDIEFIDPAILAVGKGRFPSTPSSPNLDMRSTYQSHISNYENEARLKLLMERTLLPHQNPRYVETGDNFSSRFDSYGISPRFVEQAQVNYPAHSSQFGFSQSRSQLVSNGNWDGWSEFQGGNDLRMAEFLRTERLGINKYNNGYGYDDSQYRMPTSGDLYNQTYGI